MTHSKHAHDCACGCVNSIYTRLFSGGTADAAPPGVSYSPSAEGDTRYFVFDRIYTLDEKNTVAKAVQVTGETITAVYTESEWQRHIVNAGLSETENTVSQHSGFLFPGFYEPHMHPMLDGLLQGGVDLRDVYKKDDMVLALREKLSSQLKGGKDIPENTLLLGYNIDPLNRTDEPGAGDSWTKVLDSVSEGFNNPENLAVIVEHNSMHIWYVNSKLYQIVGNRLSETGKGKEFDNVEYFPRDNGAEGTIQEDEGIAALGDALTSSGIVSLGDPVQTLANGFASIAKKARDAGCTTIADAMMGAMPGVDEAAYRVATSRDLKDVPVRVIVHPFYQQYAPDKLPANGHYYTPRMKMGAVKMVADGSLQGLTAYKAPYYNSDNQGVGNLVGEDLKEKVNEYNARDYQIMIHANGQGAIEEVVQAIEAALKTHPRSDHRHRIEHCQTGYNFLDRMAAAGIQPNFLVNHVFYWGDKYADGILYPDDARQISPVKSAYDKGMRPVLHSDAFVTPLKPLQSAWVAINRRTGNQGEPTQRVLGPEECISVEQAFRAITINAAYINFEEDIKGSIEEGKLADFTLLQQDPFDIDPMEIRDIGVIGTFIGGEFLESGDAA